MPLTLRLSEGLGISAVSETVDNILHHVILQLPFNDAPSPEDYPEKSSDVFYLIIRIGACSILALYARQLFARKPFDD